MMARIMTTSRLTRKGACLGSAGAGAPALRALCSQRQANPTAKKAIGSTINRMAAYMVGLQSSVAHEMTKATGRNPVAFGNNTTTTGVRDYEQVFMTHLWGCEMNGLASAV